MPRRHLLLILLLLTLLPGQSPAQALKCGSFPLLDDSLPEEQRSELLMKRGAICARERKPLQSIAVFSELIGLQPENMLAYLNRGSAYLQSGQFELGIADLSHVIARQPTMEEAWYNRGTAFIAARQYDRAIGDLNEAIRLNPGLAQAYCNRGFGLLQKSAYDQALADLDRGIAKNPNLAFCYYGRGELHFRREAYQKAIGDLSEGLRLQPNVQGLVTCGQAYERLGNRAKALADFNAALALVPELEKAEEGVKRLTEGSPHSRQ